MRILLDAHVSGRRVGAPLRDRGHDVLAVDEERGLDGASDEQLLALATADGRILVSFDVKDFWRLARLWAEAGRSHAGLVLVVRLDHREFGATIRGIERLFTDVPEQDDWVDRIAFVSRRCA